MPNIGILVSQRGTRRSDRTRVGASKKLSRKTEVAPLVMLVDDSEETRAMYAEFLEHAGLRTTHAVDGEHAVWKVVALQPDVVVMDLAMPVLDGWTATRQLKSNPKTKRVPVIVLTGHATDDNLGRAEDAGADVVLTKPCLPDALHAVIRKLLAKR